MSPIVMDTIWGDYPSGDLGVVHPSSAHGVFQHSVGASSSVYLRHEIMAGATPDATITNNVWMTVMTPIFSWYIRTDKDVSLRIDTYGKDFLFSELFRVYLLKAGRAHHMEGVYIPASNVAFRIFNGAGAAAAVDGFIKMRSM